MGGKGRARGWEEEKERRGEKGQKAGGREGRSKKDKCKDETRESIKRGGRKEGTNEHTHAGETEPRGELIGSKKTEEKSKGRRHGGRKKWRSLSLLLSRHQPITSLIN